MNRYLAILAGASLCASVGAVDIPSSASGDYVGNGWNCRVLAYAHATSAPHRVLELQCTGPDNRQRLTTAVSLGCPGGAPLSLYAHAGTPTSTPVLMFTSVTPYQFDTTIDGLAVRLQLSQIVPSPWPYSGCGAAPLPQPPKPWAAYCQTYIGCDW